MGGDHEKYYYPLRQFLFRRPFLTLASIFCVFPIFTVLLVGWLGLIAPWEMSSLTTHACGCRKRQRLVASLYITHNLTVDPGRPQPSPAVPLIFLLSYLCPAAIPNTCPLWTPPPPPHSLPTPYSLITPHIVPSPRRNPDRFVTSPVRLSSSFSVHLTILIKAWRVGPGGPSPTRRSYK